MLLFFTISCDKDDETSGNNFLLNGDIENGQQDWQSYSNDAFNENEFKHGVNNDFPCSGKRALFISCNKDNNNESFAYFVQSFSASVFKSGENLTLTVKVKGDNLIGEGVSVALRGYKIGAAHFRQFSNGYVIIPKFY